MSLREYKRKRDFKKTPEPSGKGAKSAPGRQFVIQKHDASRLHYNFRLEYDGTLKSWAVPKGPSLDPAVKALAVQVEDHPLDYATFEGVIPEGEYGGGTVMVWDHGTWEPEVDPAKGFKEGKLKFRLDGEKLHGSWALVRMGGRAGDDGKNWLLIKHRDEAARPDAKTDPLARKQRSVISDRSMDEIATDADRVWSSRKKSAVKKTATKKGSRAKKPTAAVKKKSVGSQSASNESETTPIDLSELVDIAGSKRAKQPNIENFSPQLATLASSVPNGDHWLYELKFDGYRLVAHINHGKVRLITRNGNDWTARFRVVADALAELPVDSAILNGEVVSLDANGLSNFQQLQNIMKHGDDGSLVYYVFDVPFLAGFDLTQVQLVNRKEVLARVLLSANPGNGGTVRYSDHIAGQGEQVLQNACRSGMEGVIAKRADGSYQQSRSPSWLKLKCLKQQEFVIGGYTKPEGSRVGFGALLLGYYQDGELIFCGRVGTGFTTQSLRQLTAELKKRKSAECPFKNPPTGFRKRGVTWVQPELVGQVEFTEWTSDGSLRHPSFQGLREDKPAEDVVREKEMKKVGRGRGPGVRGEPAESTASKRNATIPKKRAKRSTAKGGAEIEIAGVRITNPDRVLYPQQGFTKADVARYYERISDWVLPYVVSRPLTLVRCPEGQAGECFYQKHLTGSMPDAVRGIDVSETTTPEEYVMIEDLAGLISLVQMGALELHPWPARKDKLDRPDFLVFDLDPGEGVGWKEVVQGARDLRERLETAGLKTYLRTSGGKGLHVCVPIARRNDWDEFKVFAKCVADTMTREEPTKYIATMSKAKRRGKIFIDYLRNQRGATAIASYSTRARDGAPVAVPLALEELSTKTQPNMYNIENLPKRLDKLRRDPWEGFFSTRQSLTREVRAAFE